MRQLAREGAAVRLGDVADVSIGIVTGANDFFVLREAKAIELGLPSEAMKPILSKLQVAAGLVLTESDFGEARKKHLRCLLLDTRRTAGRPAVSAYLGSYPAARRRVNRTFSKRLVWHQPDDGRTPDAFFPYMSHIGPRLILNRARVNSTNTIHRVFFKEHTAKTMRLAAVVSMLTTFSQLSAEIEGRTYGSGVLKHEIRETKNIMLAMPQDFLARDLAKDLRHLDRLIRRGATEKAHAYADSIVFPSQLAGIRQLQKALDRLRQRRL